MICGVAASGRTFHFEHPVLGHLDVVTAATCAKNWVRKRSLVNSVLDEGLIDIDGHHFTHDKPAVYLFALPGLELDDFRHLAFHRGTALKYSRNLHMATPHSRQARDLKFVHTMRPRRRRLVHLFTQILCHKIPDELTRLRNVLRAVLPGDGRESEDRRVMVKRVKETVGCEIDLPPRIARRKPTGRA